MTDQQLSVGASSLALFRPLDVEIEETGQNRVGYFVPDDDSVASVYNSRRRDGKYVDTDILSGGSNLDDELEAEEREAQAAQVAANGSMEDSERSDSVNTYGFRYMRDYDAIRREAKSEYVFTIQEEDEPEGAERTITGEPRKKGAYYSPLHGHSLLRKRRARKGEPRNDYTDLGVDFWGGVLVSLGGKNVLLEGEEGEYEVDGRKEDLDLVLTVPQYLAPEESTQAGMDTKPSNNGGIDGQMQVDVAQNGVH